MNVLVLVIVVHTTQLVRTNSGGAFLFSLIIFLISNPIRERGIARFVQGVVL
jgi:hypothetical protein